jgi:hypothetical protein
MQCDKFRSRSGSIHILTEHQYRAAKSANVLNIIQYTHMGSVGSTPAVKPTQTDAEFFSEHLKDYSFPHVGLLHPQFRDDARPYIIRGPRRRDQDAAVASFYEALKVARGMWNAEIITVGCGAGASTHDIADELKVIVLVI